MGRLAAVVFDFDGTLVDTEWPIFERARAAVARLGGELTPELWAAHAVGVSHGEPYWDELAATLGLAADEAAFDAAHAAVTGIPTSRDSAVIADGAAELVHALHAEGVLLAVASGSQREWLEHHLGRFGLTDRFVHLVGIDHDDVGAGKPAPDLYDAAVAELGVDPGATVAVEDTHRGIESARAAGLAAVVAVPSRLTTHQDLTGADLVVASLAELTPGSLAALVG
ncbi:HAD family phosphatase [Iamia sp. SCSIO 61187]|uniref:HAD family hydrolase n=1 Tax=Iamia sp. SCSIO 61187 TaxID=2722752 RepID=UPI001C63AB12|nr:HAD family phosphatase [Iamia sp. SCSIO 61187]QYG94835.1 HAD family phosphatase [Iamia sp. SCSIO 61187]